MVNAIVFLSIGFAAVFFVAWLARPELRAWIERPKYRFQQNVQSYDVVTQAPSKHANPKAGSESL